jgi:nucleotide-binding universal stress UspA family protein
MKSGTSSSTRIDVGRGEAALHRIVVGIDGSPESARTLDWAITQAQQSGAALDIVTAWMFPMAIGYAFTTTVEEVRHKAQVLVDEAISHVTTVAPDVVVRGEATEQPPGPALVRASKGADLLVVGSVGHYCMRHASCSVVLVR